MLKVFRFLYLHGLSESFFSILSLCNYKVQAVIPIMQLKSLILQKLLSLLLLTELSTYAETNKMICCKMYIYIYLIKKKKTEIQNISFLGEIHQFWKPVQLPHKSNTKINNSCSKKDKLPHHTLQLQHGGILLLGLCLGRPAFPLTPNAQAQRVGKICFMM